MKISLVIFSICNFIFYYGASAQLTGVKNIPVDYPTLESAITDLNIQGVGAGGVTINLIAGNPQTAPAGGYVIGNIGSAILNGGAATSAANPVIIQGNGNTITAFSPQSVANLDDAIFKLIGADYITITGFSLQENAGNIVLAPEASNTMTEWVIALLRVSTTDGAQYNTIQNNTIALNLGYLNSFGVYSNVRHAPTTPTVAADITNITGSNSGNKIYNNAINNVNTPIYFNGSGTAAFMDDGNDIGGADLSTGNTITNWANAASLSAFVNIVLENYSIELQHQTNPNISYNTITSSATTSTTNLGGILLYCPAGAASGTFTATVTGNTMTLAKNAASGALFGINAQGVPALATLNITNNRILNCTLSGIGTSGTIYGIVTVSPCSILNITGNIIRGNSSTAFSGGFNGILNQGAVVNTININNNQIGDTNVGAVTFSSITSGQFNGILNNAATGTSTVSMNNNSIDGINAIAMGEIILIGNTAGVGYAVNINNNQLGSVTGSLISFSGPQASTFFGLYNAGSTASCAVTIQGNDFKGINQAVNCANNQQYIQNFAVSAASIISNNTFTNLVSKTTGDVYFMINQYDMPASSIFICNNNKIVGSWSKTISGGQISFLVSKGAGADGSTITETGNNFSNITVSGTSPMFAWDEEQGLANGGPAKTITGNTFKSINSNGFTVLFYLGKGSSINCSGNILSNNSSQGGLIGMVSETTANSGTWVFSGNSFYDLNAGTGDVAAIIGGTGVTSLNIFNNSISNLFTVATAGKVTGIEASGTTANIYNNEINALIGIGNGAVAANGIVIKGGGTVNIFNNKIYNIVEAGATTSAAPFINGLLISGGTNVTAYNNFISDLNTSSASMPDAIRGISILSRAPNTNYNLFYNSIYINALSSGTNFGTSGIYDSTSATATTATLTMINNAVVNLSTPKGTGVTAAFRRSDAVLTNYATTSDYNLFYTAFPAANRLIYYDGTNADQTLADYQARVAARDANSISTMPAFMSITDLHIITTDCEVSYKGTPIAGFTTDIDGNTRNALRPDIGGDEYAGYASATNVTLATSATNGLDLARVCDELGWTYYANPGDASKFLFAINWDPTGLGQNALAKANATVRITVELSPFTVNNAAIPFGTWTMLRYWNINLNGAAMTGQANIRFFYDPADTTDIGNAAAAFTVGPPAGNLEPPTWFKTKTNAFAGDAAHMNADGVYDAMGLVDVAGPGAKINNVTYAQFNGISNLHGGGTYATGVGPNTPLPITLNYLDGIKQGSNNKLAWKVTCNTTPTATLILERSRDNRNFTVIYSITADALRCQSPFDHLDTNPQAGTNYYRLKMIDASGKISYSNIIPILNETKGFAVMNISPNPVAAGQFKLRVTSAEAVKMDIVISDMQGRIVLRKTVTLIAGYNEVDMHVENLAAGIYSICGSTAQDRANPVRFIKQ